MTRDNMGKTEFDTEARAALADDMDRCPICAVPFKADDVCADDITEGTCHAECLEGSPVVDLDTGDELPDGKADTYLYRDVMTPPPQPHMRLDVDRLAAHIVTAACELDGPADPAVDDTISITMKDLEAVVHRHVTAALGRQL